jgi:hypothetical protein
MTGMIVTYEAIAKRAFEIWDREGRPEGRDQEHWFRAECELREESVQQQEAQGIRSADPDILAPAGSTVASPRKREVRPASSRNVRSPTRPRA